MSNEPEHETVQLERWRHQLSPSSLNTLCASPLLAWPSSSTTHWTTASEAPPSLRFQDALLVFPWCGLRGHSLSVFLADPSLSPKATLGPCLVLGPQVTSFSLLTPSTPTFLSLVRSAPLNLQMSNCRPP